MKRVHVLITGRVQGVFFRANIKEHANMLDIKGYAKNNEDGAVEAVFEGDDEDVQEMIDFCKEGTRRAKVEEVQVDEEEYKGKYEDFEVRI